MVRHQIADNVRVPEYRRHFLVLVSFEGRMRDPAALPSVWVIPAREIGSFMKQYKTRTVISRAAVNAQGGRFRNAWDQIAR